MRAWLCRWFFAFGLCAATPASAERLITSISSSRVLITSSYGGAELVLFGSIERDGASVSRSGSYDVVVTVKGPPLMTVVREKQRLGFIWVNQDQKKYAALPAYLAFNSSRPIADVTSEPLRQRFQLTLADVISAHSGSIDINHRPEGFHEALLRLRTRSTLFQTNERGVVFLAPNLFRTSITLPATAPLGSYEVLVTLFSDGAPLATERTNFEVVKTGFEARVAFSAASQSILYGLMTVLLALGFGWLAHFAFRRE
jgi:uncharacterized protein (TIGR02186 family)